MLLMAGIVAGLTGILLGGCSDSQQMKNGSNESEIVEESHKTGRVET